MVSRRSKSEKYYYGQGPVIEYPRTVFKLFIVTFDSTSTRPTHLGAGHSRFVHPQNGLDRPLKSQQYSVIIATVR